MAVSLYDVVGDKYGSAPLDDYSKILDDNIPIIDKEWVSSRFMVPDKELDDLYRTNRYFSTAHWKFTDSSLGGNLAINPRPQYTRYCDIRHGGRAKRVEVNIQSTNGGHGMGRYYSEAIDDNATTIFLEYGIPRFNSLVSFFTRAIDGIDQHIARTGRMPSLFYNASKTAGQILAFVFFPLTSSLIWAAKGVVDLSNISDTMFNYYYFERAMHMYWGSVNTIFTLFCTEFGVLIPIVDTQQDKAKKIGKPMMFDQEDLDAMKKVFPGLVSSTNYIDVFAISTRQQRVANALMIQEYEQYKDKKANDHDFIGYVKAHDSVKELNSPGGNIIDMVNTYLSFDNYIKKVTGNKNTLYGKNYPIEDAPANTFHIENDNDPSHLNNFIIKGEDGSYSFERTQQEVEYDTTAFGTLDSVVRDGGLFLALNVDYQGSVSESFSNSTGEIPTSSAIKSVAKGVQDIRFSLADGNISNKLNKFIETTKDVLYGVAEGVTFGLSNVIATIFGGGYIDIPKKWEDSEMSLPSITYKTRLITPYGIPLSQLQNIYLPLSCLLAGTLPMSVGKSSYASPFLCRIFNKGVQDIKLGMITSLSIERGTSNLGFNKLKRALAIDVSFTVTDFSNLFTAPISRNVFGDSFSISMEDDKPLNQYIATCAARDYLTNKYFIPKIKIYASRKLMGMNQFISPHSFAFRTGEALNGVLGPFVVDKSTLELQSNFK